MLSKKKPKADKPDDKPVSTLTKAEVAKLVKRQIKEVKGGKACDIDPSSMPSCMKRARRCIGPLIGLVLVPILFTVPGAL